MPGKIHSDRDPYGGLFAYPDGTTGHVDRPASIERAHREADDGTAGERALAILGVLAHEPLGVTWGEIADRLQLHHGQASGALSNLHKQGRVFMLRAKRGKAHPYVHDKYRDAYAPNERYDTPAQTQSGKIREIERQLCAALEADYRRGLHLEDRYLDSLVGILVDLHNTKGQEK